MSFCLFWLTSYLQAVSVRLDWPSMPFLWSDHWWSVSILVIEWLPISSPSWPHQIAVAYIESEFFMDLFQTKTELAQCCSCKIRINPGHKTHHDRTLSQAKSNPSQRPSAEQRDTKSDPIFHSSWSWNWKLCWKNGRNCWKLHHIGTQLLVSKIEEATMWVNLLQFEVSKHYDIHGFRYSRCPDDV